MGAILYQLLTGRPPFQGASPAEVLAQVRDQDPVSPRLLNPSVPLDLETVCLKCLEKDPARRFGTAQQLVEELDRFLCGEPVHARPVTEAGRCWRWCRRKPALAGALGAAIVFFVAGLAGVLWQWRNAQQHATSAMQASALARANELRALRAVYAADMTLAYQAFEAGNFGRARGLAEKYQPGHELRPSVGHGASDGKNFRAASSSKLQKAEQESDFRGWEWRYLKAHTRGEQIATLGWFSNIVTQVAISADGALAAASDAEGRVRLWDIATRRLVAELTFPPWVASMAFSPDGRSLAVGGKDRIQIWNIRERTWSEAFPGRQAGPVGGALAFSRDGFHLAVGESTNGQLRVWNLGTRTSFDLVGHRFGVSGLSFSSDGRWLASSSSDRTVRIWDWRRRASMQVITNFSSMINTVVFSPDGRSLAASEMDFGVKMFDADTLRLRFALTNHSAPVWSLTFLPDGKKLVTAAADQLIKFWDTTTGSELGELRGHGDEVNGVAASADGGLLISGGKEGSVRLWSSEAIHATNSLADRLRNSDHAALSPDGRALLTVHGPINPTFQLWRTEDFQWPEPLPFAFPASRLLALSAEGRFAASAELNGIVKIWNPANRMMERQIDTGSESIRQLRFASDSNLLAVAQKSGIRLFNAATGESLFTIPNQDRREKVAGFSPGGRWVAVGNLEDSLVELWDLEQRKLQLVLKGHQSYVVDAAFSPDGRTVATAGLDAKLKLWNAATGECVETLTGQMNAFNAVCFSPDGTRLAAIGSSSLLKIWDAVTHQELANLTGPRRSFTAVRFSQSGNSLIAVDYDEKAAEVWSAVPLN